MSEEQHLTSRSIRSFVVRNGRVTSAQHRAMQQHWPAYGIEFREQQMDFNTQFSRQAPLWIEIGFGNGEQTAHLATEFPELNILGIEVHLAGVGRLLNRAHEKQTQNLKIMRHDAVEVLQHCVADASVDKVCLFFPDPWPKKKHHKRRIVQTDFIRLVARKLRPGAQLHLATDWEAYAEHMLEVCDAEPLLCNNSTDDGYVQAPAYRLQTHFEKRGVNKGHGVWDLVYTRTLITAV